MGESYSCRINSNIGSMRFFHLLVTHMNGLQFSIISTTKAGPSKLKACIKISTYQLCGTAMGKNRPLTWYHYKRRMSAGRNASSIVVISISTIFEFLFFHQGIKGWLPIKQNLLYCLSMFFFFKQTKRIPLQQNCVQSNWLDSFG